MNCSVSHGIIVVYVLSAEEVSLLLSDVSNFVSDVNFHLISSFLYLLVPLSEEIFLYFFTFVCPFACPVFLNQQKTKTTVRTRSITSLDSHFKFIITKNTDTPFV